MPSNADNSVVDYEKTQIATDIEKATSLILQFCADTRNSMAICADKCWFSIVADTELYKKEFNKMKERGAKLRLISEITPENISYCKKVMEWTDEIRHLTCLSCETGACGFWAWIGSKTRRSFYCL